MAPIDTQVDSLAELAFELERFEWTAADRLEVSGRWFGVRGRRFVRPTLHLRVDGRRRRLIAVLDHKPWAADTEALWTAAFTWRGEHSGVTATRLEVSPDVILDLPAPGGEAPAEPLVPRPRPKPAPRPARKPPTAELSPVAARAHPDAQAASEPAPPVTEASSPGTADAVVTPPPAEPASPPADPPSDAPAGAVPPPAEPGSPPAETAPDAPAGAAPPLAETPPAAPREDFSRASEADVRSAPEPLAVAPPAPPAHAQSSVAAEIALLALERRLAEERAEREALARELAEARRQIEGLSAHHDSALERAQEIVELEGKLAVAAARGDAAVAHVTRLERELAELQVASEHARPVEVAPLPPRTPRRRRTEDWDTRTRIAAIAMVAVALIVVMTIALTLL